MGQTYSPEEEQEEHEEHEEEHSLPKRVQLILREGDSVSLSLFYNAVVQTDQKAWEIVDDLPYFPWIDHLPVVVFHFAMAGVQVGWASLALGWANSTVDMDTAAEVAETVVAETDEEEMLSVASEGVALSHHSRRRQVSFPVRIDHDFQGHW